MPEKKNHSELPVEMSLRALMGFVLYILLYILFKLLFVSFGDSDFTPALGAAAITLGVLVGSKGA